MPHEEIDGYIAQFSGLVKKRLQLMRKTIEAVLPADTEATLAYQMPTYKLNGNLVHFAGYKNHVGFYPAPSGIKAFQKQIEKYVWAKGSVQFPHTQPLPVDLIRKIVRFRLQENSSSRMTKPRAGNGT